MDTRSSSCSLFLNQKATGHLQIIWFFIGYYCCFGVSVFYFAIKLAPWKPLFHLKVSTVLSIISYFCLPTQFISAWIFQFWHLCTFTVIPADVHHERESANVIKEDFKYFSWEWAKLEEQLASMVVEFPIENITSVVILVTDQSCR